MAVRTMSCTRVRLTQHCKRTINRWPFKDDNRCTEATLSNRRLSMTDNREIAAALGRELWSTESFIPRYRGGENGGSARSYAVRANASPRSYRNGWILRVSFVPMGTRRLNVLYASSDYFC
ncbi:hypothetical protein Rcae01_01056 [Novipirellula caenicola]|uniref:Uncharacterized protein n=1 Tax=Novipirellula caenicola TaxID=1536901 RepID=A0ABP9VLR2_9BACT